MNIEAIADPSIRYGVYIAALYRKEPLIMLCCAVFVNPELLVF